MLVVVLLDAPLIVGCAVLETGGSRGVPAVPFAVELVGRSGTTAVSEARCVLFVPAIGVRTLVERLRINLPWTTMLSLDFFRSLVNISRISISQRETYHLHRVEDREHLQYDN